MSGGARASRSGSAAAKPAASGSNTHKVVAFAERLNALAEAYRADIATVVDQAKAADVDGPALKRLASWMRKDELARQEQEAVDDQYRFLAGLLPTPAELPAEGELATAAALFADKMTIRAVAKEMGLSVGKVHQLKIKAAAFNVHSGVNMNKPAHDPATSEVIEDTVKVPASDSETHADEPRAHRMPDEVVSAPSSGTHSEEGGAPNPVRDGEASADERDASASSSPPTRAEIAQVANKVAINAGEVSIEAGGDSPAVGPGADLSAASTPRPSGEAGIAGGSKQDQSVDLNPKAPPNPPPVSDEEAFRLMDESHVRFTSLCRDRVPA